MVEEVFIGRSGGAPPTGAAGRWVYFGGNSTALRELRRQLGPSRVPAAVDLVDEVALRVRRDFAEFDASVDAGDDDLLWDASTAAERNPYTSGFFYACCTVIAFERLLAAESGALAVVVDDGLLARELARRARERGVRVTLARPLRQRAAHAMLPLLALGRGILSRIRFVGRVASRRRLLRRLGPPDRGHVDVVLVTWAAPSTFPAGAEKAEDVYFGILPAELRARGLRVGYLANPLSWVYDYGEIAAGARAAGDPVLLPEDCIRVGDAALLALRTLVRRFRVVRPFVLDGVDLTRVLREELLREHAGVRQTEALQHELVGRRLAAMRPRAVVYVFENQSWERALHRGVERGGTPAVGYQHAPVPLIWTPFFLSGRERRLGVLPRRIVAIGEYWRRMFESLGYPPERLRVGAAYRFGHVGEEPGAPSGAGAALRLLVAAPVGSAEAFELLALVLGAVPRLDDVRVIVKLHPAMGVPGLVEQVCAELGLASLPAAVTVEEAPLGDLLRRSDVLAYTGSASAYEAIGLGLPVVSVRSSLWLDTDPVPPEFAGRNRVRTEDEFVACLEALRSEDLPAAERRRAAEAEFVTHAFRLPGGAPEDVEPFLEGLGAA